MPLLITALTASPGLPGAAGRDYPLTVAECATEWADAVQAWAAGIVPPSATVSAAAQTLAAQLTGAFQAADPVSVLAAIEAAFAAFAATVGAGMAGYVPVPPVAPIGFAQLMATAAQTRVEGVQKVASALDAWMRTGVSTLAVTPFTVVPWT
jgi:hypothetical protein